MKKILLLSPIFLLAFMLGSCSTPTEWSEEQRVEFITFLDPYRQMIYLNELNDDEFVVFTTDLSEDIESTYPVYTKFVSMPELSDTLDVWVVTSVVEDITADASNMRYLYPYRTLISQGVLPEGLDRKAQNAFYQCFADGVDAHFESMDSFFYAVITNTLDPNIISEIQTHCAKEWQQPIVEE